jgi:hypothetical protein
LKISKYAIEGEDDEPAAFVREAFDRCSTGIEHFPEHASLWFTRAKIRIAEVDNTMSECKPKKRYSTAAKLLPTIDKALKDFEKGESLALAGENALLEPEHLDIIADLLQIGDLFGELDDDEEGDLVKATERYLEWSRNRWERILESVPAGKGKSKMTEDDSSFTIVRKANKGMGQYYLSLSMPIVQRIEESDSEDEGGSDDEQHDKENDTEEIEKAKKSLGKAIQYLSKAETEEEPQTLVEIAEAQLTLANLLEEDCPDQRRLYAEAASRLKRAQRLGHGNYQDLIAELED